MQRLSALKFCRSNIRCRSKLSRTHLEIRIRGRTAFPDASSVPAPRRPTCTSNSEVAHRPKPVKDPASQFHLLVYSVVDRILLECGNLSESRPHPSRPRISRRKEIPCGLDQTL